MSNFCFGVDLGGTTVKLGLFTDKGEVIDKWEIPTRKENNGDLILPDIADAIKGKMEEKQIDASNVVGVGIGVPGPVDEDGLVHRTVNIGWGYVNVVEVLSKLTGFKVKAANDASAAALGEIWKGGGMGYKNAVLLTLGTGVGGGVIVNGKVLAGETGAGGEVGHIHVEDNESLICTCGNYGCLEQYASATGITRLANRRLAKDDMPSVLRTGEVNAKTVFDAVKAGDALAIEVATQFGEYLGKCMAGVAGVTNPAVFIIGGGVSKAGEILFDFVREPFKKYAFHACQGAEFVLAKLGNDAGIYGAAKLILDEE